jgi:hypothetical protein
LEIDSGLALIWFLAKAALVSVGVRAEVSSALTYSHVFSDIGTKVLVEAETSATGDMNLIGGANAYLRGGLSVGVAH